MDKKAAVKTLRELIEEYGANGVIRIDAGNGCAGVAWIDWDEDTDYKIGGVAMLPCKPTDRAYEDDDNQATLLDEAQYLASAYDNVDYASDWIEDDDRNEPYRATNPYRYRLIF